MTNKNVLELVIQGYSLLNAITPMAGHFTTLSLDTVQAIELLIVSPNFNNIPVCE